MKKRFDYLVAVGIGFAINLPIYFVFYLFDLPPEMPIVLAVTGVVLLAPLIVVFISYFFLKNFTSGFNLKNGLTFGLILTSVTLTGDLIFFGWFRGERLGFLKWYVNAMYLEMLIIPPIIGQFLETCPLASQSQRVGRRELST